MYTQKVNSTVFLEIYSHVTAHKLKLGEWGISANVLLDRNLGCLFNYSTIWAGFMTVDMSCPKDLKYPIT